jgi:hypothetical protein
MGQPIEINRTEFSVSEFRALAPKIRDGAMVRRLFAIALLLKGQSRATIARANGATGRL